MCIFFVSFLFKSLTEWNQVYFNFWFFWCFTPPINPGLVSRFFSELGRESFFLAFISSFLSLTSNQTVQLFLKEMQNNFSALFPIYRFLLRLWMFSFLQHQQKYFSSNSSKYYSSIVFASYFWYLQYFLCRFGRLCCYVVVVFVVECITTDGIDSIANHWEISMIADSRLFRTEKIFIPVRPPQGLLVMQLWAKICPTEPAMGCTAENLGKKTNFGFFGCFFFAILTPQECRNGVGDFYEAKQPKFSIFWATGLSSDTNIPQRAYNPPLSLWASYSAFINFTRCLGAMHGRGKSWGSRIGAVELRLGFF